MTTTHAEIVQAARNLHDQIRHAGFRQAQDILDNPTPFHPGNDVFYDHACTGDEVIEEPVCYAQLLAFGFFFWLLREDARRLIALKARVLVERGVGRIGNLSFIGRFLVVLFPPTVGPR